MTVLTVVIVGIICLVCLISVVISEMTDKKVGVMYNVVPLTLMSGLLVVSIFVKPNEEPAWRFKPCILETPTEKLVGFSAYRNQLIIKDYHQYRCY